MARTCAAALLLATLSTGCRGPDLDVAQPWKSGTLVTVTLNSPTTYYLDRDEQAVGPEHDLVAEFAANQGWEVSWIVVDHLGEVFDQLDAGNAHLAAAGLTHLPERNRHFQRGPVYRTVNQQLVCHRSLRPLPETPELLAGINIAVAGRSSYVSILDRLVESHPAVAYTEHEDLGTEPMLMKAARQEIDCTVADSHIVRTTRRVFPSLEVALDLSDEQALGWYLPKGSRRLARQAKRWMKRAPGREAIARMEERYFHYIDDFDFVDLRALNRRIRSRLPQYRRQFLRAEERTGLPADLLAAVAYQESHWDPRARSPTGVRGMMMLTQRTAAALGVSNRLDPAQSIDAGARYLADLHARLPEEIPEPDRTFLALASYNIGRGHLLDARGLARDLGKDPDSWQDMREVLPLLADERYYQDLRFGYARGHEAVHFVQRVRNYRDIIRHAFD